MLTTLSPELKEATQSFIDHLLASEAFMLGGRSRCSDVSGHSSLTLYRFAHSVPPQPALLDSDVKQAGQPPRRVVPNPRAQVL
jgi:hypothetical protein